MSTNADAPATPAEPMSQHDDVKAALAEAREWLTHKLADGRIRNEEHHELYVKTARALAYVANVELRAIEADTLEELTEDVARLKEDRDLS